MRPEESFQSTVVAYAQFRGWLVAHFRPAQTKFGWCTPVSADGRGFPDLIMLRGDRMVIAELKVGRNKPSDDQLKWLQAFGRIRGDESEVYVWYPEDWAEIEEVLR